MKPRDLDAVVTVPAVAVAPDGGRVVFSRRAPNLLADENSSRLWTIDLDAAEPTSRMLTRGRADTDAAFSPDGTALAFLRLVEGKPQLAITRADGGEPLVITDQPLGVSVFRWSPDGRSIAYLARVADAGRYGTTERVEPTAEPARRFTTYRTRLDGVGVTVDRPAHAFVVDVPDLDADPWVEPLADAGYGLAELLDAAPPRVPASRRLTAGIRDHAALDWSADGTSVLVVGAWHDTADVDSIQSVAAFPRDADADAASVDPQIVVGPEHGLGISALAVASDGAVFLLGQHLGDDGRDFPGRSAGVFLADGGTVRRLTDVADDLGEPGAPLSALADGAGLAHVRERGEQHLVRVARDGTVARLTSGPVDVLRHDTAGERIVVAVADAQSFGEVALVEDGALRPLTDLAADLRGRGIRPAVEITATSADGTPVHGWVVLPEGDGPHPVLLNIHGGPFAQYGVALFDEAQVYADAGYAVLLPNPRGSAGYGEEHARAILGRMGTVDMDDVLAFLDHALATRDDLDAERVGIMGGSYGGYLTAWITSHHPDRFTAAIVERAYLDPETFLGTSDIGSWFVEPYNGVDRERMAAQSPLRRASHVRTPTLVIHSEGDLRCPIFQAEQYVFELRRAGTEVEFLVFPGESHGLSRVGRPRHRLQRFEAILDWWERHLPVGG